MKKEKLTVGIIGCGNISDIYLTNMTQTFRNVVLKACADIIPEKAMEKAEEYGIAHCTVDEMLADPEIDLVVNLTIPQAHFEVSRSILESGKHVYSEKPLAIEVEDGRALLDLAEEKALILGCAPDTFMGGGIQTCKKLVDDGWIGIPIGATVFMGYSGPESWHPAPAFLYHKGAGPLFDIGSYYLTALVALFGSIEKISGSAKITFPERTITSEPLYGEKIVVEEPTHVTAMLNFANGVTVTLTMSFDVSGSVIPNMELYGNKGTIIGPDPNTYGGPVRYCAGNPDNWDNIPVLFPFTENSRGLAVHDMAKALLEGRDFRSNGKVAFHVLEALHGIIKSSDAGEVYCMSSSCTCPDSMEEFR